jgi:hypothetical protein
MIYRRIVPFSLGLLLLLAGCKPENGAGENIDALEVENQVVDSSNLASDAFDGKSGSINNAVNDAIVQYGISLTDDEKAAVLEPIKESLGAQTDNDHLKDLRAKIELMLDIREAQLKEEPDFESLLNEQIGKNFSKVDWENTVSSIQDMDELNDARRKLDKQFPSSPEEAILQAQDALFQKALNQKLRDVVTKEIVVSPTEVNEFLSQSKASSNVHVLYLAKYRDAETAALELKRDQYWNAWLSAREK